MTKTPKNKKKKPPELNTFKGGSKKGKEKMKARWPSNVGRRS